MSTEPERYVPPDDPLAKLVKEMQSLTVPYEIARWKVWDSEECAKEKFKRAMQKRELLRRLHAGIAETY